ncbi:hypothetical protein T08_5709 [Trichinella sp. T8]|nr:hypothetical protein T08_5709 [Trichinella sp. T8]
MTKAELEQDLEAEGRRCAIGDWRKENSRRVPTAAATAELPGNGKLPELRLPQFTWAVLKFPIFWAQYASSVHERSDLDIATKFAYLVPTTEGKMQSTIERILITAANYPLAVKILKSRLSRPEIVACERSMALWKATARREMTTQGIQILVRLAKYNVRLIPGWPMARWTSAIIRSTPRSAVAAQTSAGPAAGGFSHRRGTRVNSFALLHADFTRSTSISNPNYCTSDSIMPTLLWISISPDAFVFGNTRHGQHTLSTPCLPARGVVCH